jgi:uncharacterized protein (TIGR02453 family)
MVAFLEALDERFQPFHLFRPYRDLRFAKDKAPYKTQIGAVSEGKGGEVYYVHLSTWGLFTASGYHTLAKDQLARFRAAIDDERSSIKLEEIIQQLKDDGYTVTSGVAEPLKTTPRGYAKDHPRAEMLRWKGLTISHDFGAPNWLHTTQPVERVHEVWQAAGELNDWLGTYVGRSQETSEATAVWTR